MEPSSSLSLCPSRHHNSLKRSVAVHMHGLERWPKCARARARIVRVRVRKNFSQILAFVRQMSFSLHVVNNKQTNKSMDKLKKYELCVVFIDRNGTSYECFVPLLGPAFLSFVGGLHFQAGRSL